MQTIQQERSEAFQRGRCHGNRLRLGLSFGNGNRFQIQFDRRRFLQQVAQFLQQALSHIRKLDRGRHFLRSKNAGEDISLGGQGIQHAFFDGVLGNQVDDLHRGWLAEPVGAGDALLEHGGIPGQVEVDDQAGGLQVETHPAGIGGEEDATVGIIEEFLDEVAALAGWHITGQLDVAQADTLDDRFGQRQHGSPLAEN